MQESLQLALSRLQEIGRGILEAVPVIISGVLIFLAGWFLANLLRVLTEKIVFFLDPHRIFKLRKRNYDLPLIIGNLVYWSVLFMSVVLTLSVFGVKLSESIEARLLQVFPSIIVALLLLLFGFFLAFLTEKAGLKLLAKADTRTGKIWLKVFKWVTLFFIVILALQQLGLAANFVLSLVQILAAAAGLALALAFGLGCKDIARDMIVEFFRHGREEA